jgi:hypothetical protein
VRRAAVEAALGIVADVAVELDSAGLREAVSRAAAEAGAGQEATVRVGADTTPAERPLDALRRQLAEIARSVATASVRADTTEARVRLDVVARQIDDLSRHSASIRTEVQAVGALSTLEELRVSTANLNGRSVNIHANADTALARLELDRLDKAVRDVGNFVNIRPRVDTSSAESEMRHAGSVIDQALSSLPNLFEVLKIPALLSGLQVAAGAIAALGAGAVGLAAGIAPAVGGLAALPALAVAAASGLGAVKLATTGVGDALKAMAKDQDSAAAAGSDASRKAIEAAAAQEAAQDRILTATQSLADARRRSSDAAVTASDAEQRAERDLARAQVDARQAQLDLNRAREDALRQLEDLRTANERDALSEERAILNVAEAHRRQQQTNADPRADALARREAALSVREAEESLAEVQKRRVRDAQDLATAEKKGVDGSDSVVAAQKRVADANQAVLDSQRSLAKAVHDGAESQRAAAQSVANATRELARAQEAQARQGALAADQQTASAKAAQQALANLSPAARSFAEFLLSLRPKLKDLQATAAEGLFPGVEAGVRSLLPLVPIVSDAIGKAAGVVGSFVAQAGALVGSAPFRADLAGIVGHNTTLLSGFGTAALNVLDALRNLSASGAPLADLLASAVVRASVHLRDFIQRARDSGGLARFFDAARESISRVADIAVNLGRIFINLLVAGHEFGAGLLTSIDKATRKLADFTSSVAGQNALKRFFDDAKPVLAETAQIIGAIAKAFVGLAADSNVAAVLHLLGNQLLPVIIQIGTSASKSLTPALIDLFTQFARILRDLSGASSVLPILVEGLANLARVLANLIELVPGGGKVLGTLLLIGTVARAVKLGELVTGMFGFAGSLRAVTAEGGGAVGVVGALSRSLLGIPAKKTVEVAIKQTVTSAAGSAAGGAIGGAAGGVTVRAGIGAALGGIGAAIGETLAGVGASIAAFFASPAFALAAVIAAAVAVAVVAFHFREQIGRFVTQTLPRDVGGPIGRFFSETLPRDLLGPIGRFFSDTLPRALEAGARFLVTGLPRLLGQAVGTAVAALLVLFVEVPIKLVGALVLAAPRLVEAGAQLALSLGSGLESGLTRDVLAPVGRFFAALPGQVLGFVASLPGRLGDLLSSVGAEASRFPGLIGQAFASIPGLVRGIVDFLDSVPAAVGSAFASIPGLVGSALGSLGSVLAPVAAAVGRFVSDLFGLVSQAAGAFAGGFADAFSRVNELTGGFLGDIASSIGRVAVGIVNGAVSIVGTLLGVGRDIIGGLVRGIISRAGDVVSAIKDFVLDRIPGFIKRFFGIASPSTMFAGFGRDLVAGLATGIRSSGDQATAAVRAVAERIQAVPLDRTATVTTAAGAISASLRSLGTLSATPTPTSGSIDTTQISSAAQLALNLQRQITAALSGTSTSVTDAVSGLHASADATTTALRAQADEARRWADAVRANALRAVRDGLVASLDAARPEVTSATSAITSTVAGQTATLATQVATTTGTAFHTVAAQIPARVAALTAPATQVGQSVGAAAGAGVAAGMTGAVAAGISSVAAAPIAAAAVGAGSVIGASLSAGLAQGVDPLPLVPAIGASLASIAAGAPVANTAGFDIGSALGSGFVSGIAQFLPSADGEMKRSIAALAVGGQGQAYAGGLSIGEAIDKGIAVGMFANKDQAAAAAKAIIADTGNIFKNVAEIHSPSALFARTVGLPIAQGIALGLRQGGPALAAQTRQLSTMLTTTANDLRGIGRGFSVGGLGAPPSGFSVAAGPAPSPSETNVTNDNHRSASFEQHFHGLVPSETPSAVNRESRRAWFLMGG